MTNRVSLLGLRISGTGKITKVQDQSVRFEELAGRETNLELTCRNLA